MSEETQEPHPEDLAAEAAEFNELDQPSVEDAPLELGLLYDLSMPVAIELGRTRMAVREILALGRGSVIQLDRLAGEPIDVFVGDRKLAEGEVVVVGEQFGVRVTRIVSAGGIGEQEARA
ncbi:MAG: flagellar motor switch protein FliN [Gemmatimonadota bacterium]